MAWVDGPWKWTQAFLVNKMSESFPVAHLLCLSSSLDQDFCNLERNLCEIRYHCTFSSHVGYVLLCDCRPPTDLAIVLVGKYRLDRGDVICVKRVITEWMEIFSPFFFYSLFHHGVRQLQVLPSDRARLPEQLVQPAGLPWADNQHPTGASDSCCWFEPLFLHTKMARSQC